MTKCRKIIIYVLELDNEYEDDEVKDLIEDNRWLDISMGKVESTDIGKWHDGHELNKINCDYEKYFK